MRIIFLTPSNRLLGARKSLLDLVTHLPASVEPLVVCPDKGDLEGVLRASGVRVAVVAHGAWRKIGRIRAELRQIPALRRIAAEFRPDLVHANEFHIVPQGGQIRWADPDGREHRPPLVGYVRLGITPRQIENYRMSLCRRIVCVSRAVADLFAGSGLEDRVRVVHNGIAVDAFHPPQNNARERHPELPPSWPESALVLGVLGLVSERKNQLRIAEAVAIARSRGADVRLVIAGDSFKSSLEYGDELRQRITQPDLRDAVEWLPFREDVAAVYRALDVNLLISNEEGFGRTIIEAGAAARPSIGARTGGIPELISESETGWLVAPDSAGEIAAAILHAHDHRAEVRRRGAAMQERVRAHFTLEATVRNTMTVYGELTGNPGGK